jgi:heme exporter protein C
VVEHAAQGATISATAAPKMASTMLTAMLLMTLAFWAYAFAVVFTRARAIVLERDRHASWVRETVGAAPPAGAPGMQT